MRRMRSAQRPVEIVKRLIRNVSKANGSMVD